MTRARLAVLAGVLGAASLGPAAAAGPADSEAARVIVTLTSAADAAPAETSIDSGPGDAQRIGPRTLVIDASATTIAQIADRPDVIRVESDQRARASLLPNDPCVRGCMGARSWHIQAIRADAAWTRSRGDGVIIAVLDTGVDASHPDLAAKIAGPAINTTGANDGIGDHGTAVAGIAAATTDNGVGIPGVGWNARILPVKVLDANGEGWVSWITQGIYASVDRGARVINLSLSADQSSFALSDAVAYAQSRGAVVVAAAGNQGGTAPRYPAAIPGVVGVAAADQSLKLASFSNRGDWIDLAAPGVSIPAPVPGGYATFDGTSVAAPIVAGAIALLLAQEPSTTPASVESRLQTGGSPLTDGSGLPFLDAAGLMQLHSPYGVFRGGMRIARGDVDGDGRSEIITGAGPGGGPHILVFDDTGRVKASFFAYSPGFLGGVDVAAADLNGDGKAEIITGAGPGGGPHVMVFSGTGAALGGGFFAYAPAFGGGIRVAAGDLDGDGRSEIITGAGPGGGPHVQVFSGSGVSRDGGFMAYAPTFTAGIDVAAGDLDGDGRSEIITGAGPGGGPHVQVFSAAGVTRHGFYAYYPSFVGGVQVSAGDVDGDGRMDILTGAGPGGGPHVRGFLLFGQPIYSEFAFGPFFGGVDVAGAVDGTAWSTLAGEGLVRAASRLPS